MSSSFVSALMTMKNKICLFSMMKLDERQVYYLAKKGKLTLKAFRHWFNTKSNKKGIVFLLESGFKPPKVRDGVIVDYD